MAEGDYVCLSITDSGSGMSDGDTGPRSGALLHDQGSGQGNRPRAADGAWPGGSVWRPVSAPQHARASARRPSCGCRVAPVDPKATATAHPRVADAADSPSMVVVAVDDDALVLAGTVAMLEDLGHTVLAATSGQQAIEIRAGRAEGGHGHHGSGDAAHDRHRTDRQAAADQPRNRDHSRDRFRARHSRPRPFGRQAAKPFDQDDLAAAIQQALQSAPVEQVAP